MPKSSAETIFERIGGMGVINRTVDILYDRIALDPELNPFFQNLCMARQRVKLKAFLAMVTGGPEVYTGKNLREAHAASVQQGLNNRHMDKLLKLLSTALLEQGVNRSDMETIIAIAESVRADILNH